MTTLPVILKTPRESRETRREKKSIVPVYLGDIFSPGFPSGRYAGKGKTRASVFTLGKTEIEVDNGKNQECA